MVVYNVYDQIAELIANLNPTKVMGLKADKELQNRFENLVRKSKESQLDIQEKDELDHYIVLERLIRLAKIRSTQSSFSV
jgi:predicted house-cleaning noncanonical NTP pyrophosphatase (MazG superfamily)